MKEKKKFKVLKEWLWIDYNSLDNVLFEQNLLVTRLREENQTLKDKIEFLTNCIDDRDKSIELLKEKIKKMEKAEERFFELMKNYVMNKKEDKDLETLDDLIKMRTDL